jgi:hypothetical protein
MLGGTAKVTAQSWLNAGTYWGLARTPARHALLQGLLCQATVGVSLPEFCQCLMTYTLVRHTRYMKSGSTSESKLTTATPGYLNLKSHRAARCPSLGHCWGCRSLTIFGNLMRDDPELRPDTCPLLVHCVHAMVLLWHASVLYVRALKVFCWECLHPCLFMSWTDLDKVLLRCDN